MTPTPESIRDSRRTFLRNATAGIGLTLSASAIASIIAGCETDESPLNPTGKTFTVDINAYRELAVVGGITIDTIDGLNNNGPVFLSRVDADAVAVFSAVCTHQGCTVLPPFQQGEPCECPCHGAQYSPENGKNVRQPSTGSATDLPFYSSSFDAASGQLTITDA